MNNINIKSRLLEICTNMQMQRLEVIQKAMQESQQSANEYGQPKDRYDSYRMQLLSNREMLGHQLQKSELEFLALKKIDVTIKHEIVDFGALVFTNTQKLFVSIGIGKIELEKDIYYAISPNVPIYNILNGLKKGDEFTFNGVKNKIIDLL